MKKRMLILIGLLLVISLTAFAACGSSSETSDADLSDSPYVGTWVATGLTLGDQSGEVGDWIMVLNADGTGTLSGEGEESSFTWAPKEGGGFSTDGDVKTDFKDEEGGIKAKVIGVSLHFVKAEPEDLDAETPADDAARFGYTGKDPAEAACYQYMVEEVAPGYEPAEDAVSVPAITIVNKKNGEDGKVDVYGDFWIYNYEVEGDTLKCVSGGNYAGVMHVAQDGDEWKVESFDQCEDGGNFDPSAKEIFGDDYDAFMKVYSDDEANEKVRAQTLADYVKANGLAVTKYQDEGWNPVDLPL